MQLVVESFVKTEDTETLKVEVEKQKVVNVQAAREKISQEKAEVAAKEAVKEERVVEVKSDIKQTEKQEEVVNTEIKEDKKLQKEANSQDSKNKDLEEKKLARKASRDMRKALKENAVGTGSSSVGHSKSSGKSHSYNQDM